MNGSTECITSDVSLRLPAGKLTATHRRIVTGVKSDGGYLDRREAPTTSNNFTPEFVPASLEDCATVNRPGASTYRRTSRQEHYRFSILSRSQGRKTPFRTPARQQGIV